LSSNVEIVKLLKMERTMRRILGILAVLFLSSALSFPGWCGSLTEQEVESALRQGAESIIGGDMFYNIHPDSIKVIGIFEEGN
jgi:hypothetical protein